ncbi:MAG TPA: FHA domain-containing protein, partial [Micromonosporaceae bacterium]|nr:FHA domain-containing protein [Micromonosporaceae bacterium]
PEPYESIQDSAILAVLCQDGHANPPNSTRCRVCGSPVARKVPQFVAGPVLAVLRASDGSTADLDRPVLIGRAPSGDRSGSRAPRLMTVPSPNHDISRTHIEVAPEDWQIVVTDLNSTNGTVLVRPGAVDRQQLAPGEPVHVQLGSVIELGDGVSVLIDFPQ